MANKHSAGILLFRKGPAGALEFLLVHPGGPYWAKRDLGAWSIPKGQIENGEDPHDCALREMAEELGPAPELAPEQLITLGSIRQRAGKLVEAWAGEADFDPAELDSNRFALEWPPRSGHEQEFPEVDRAAWFGLEEARRRILPAQAELLDRLVEHLDAG